MHIQKLFLNKNDELKKYIIIQSEKLLVVTYDLDSADLLYKECWDDVARQNSHTAQEADQVDQMVILFECVQVAAVFVLLKGGVLHHTVDEHVLLQV